MVLLAWLTTGGLWLARWCLEAADTLPGFWAFYAIVVLPFNGEGASWLREELSQLTLAPNRFDHWRDNELHRNLFTSTGTQLTSGVCPSPGDKPSWNPTFHPKGMDQERGLRPVERHRINEVHRCVG